MILALGILGWFILGALNVVWSGSIDRRIIDNTASAPTGFLFVAGPVGSVLCLIVEIFVAEPTNFISYLYKLGKGKD